MNEPINTVEPIVAPETLNVDALNGLSVNTRNSILEAFKPFAMQFDEWEAKANQIQVTDVSQTDLMKAARESRLALVKVRTSADKVRKELKADATQYNKAVQDIYNKLEAKISSIEEHLEKQEKFKELVEAQERQAKIAERMDRVKEFPAVTSEMVINLSDEMFETFVGGLKAQKEAAEKAEAERVAQEKREQEIRNIHAGRKEILMSEGLWQHMSEESKEQNFGTLTNDEWNTFVKVVESVKATYEAEQEKIRLENERLKKEAEEAETKRIEQARQRTIRTSQLSQCGYTHHSDVAELTESEFETLLADKKAIYDAKEAERLALEKRKYEEMEQRGVEAEKFLLSKGFIKGEHGMSHGKFQYFMGASHYSTLTDDDEFNSFIKGTENQIDLLNEKEENKRLADELAQKQKEEAERKAEAERLEKARIAAEKKAAKAPDATKIKEAVQSLSMPELSLKSEESVNAYAEITSKFESFKSWANQIAENI